MRGHAPMKFLFCAALATALAGFGRIRAGEEKVVRFGACISLTGEFAPLGNTLFTGLELRLNEFNEEGELPGVRLEMEVRDDASDPDRAREIAREFAAREDIVAVVGPVSTTLALAMREIISSARVPLVMPSVTSPLLGRDGDRVFRILFDDDFQGRALAEFLFGKLGLKRAAVVLNSRFEYGVSISRAFKDAFIAQGGTIVLEERYSRDLDSEEAYGFVPILERVKAANPQAVLLPCYAEDVVAIIQDSLELDFVDNLGLPIRFCGGDSWHQDSVLNESGYNLNDSYYVGPMDDDNRRPANTHFLRLLNLSNETTAEMSSARGYDALSVIAEALKTGLDRESATSGLYALRNFPLVTGNITFDREKGTLKTAYVIRIRIRDGVLVREVVAIVDP